MAATSYFFKAWWNGDDAAAGIKKSTGGASHVEKNLTMKSNPAYDMRDVESGKGQGNALDGAATYNLSGETSDSLATVRLGFIRKVFMILTLQLTVTFSIVLIFNIVEPINTFCKANGSWLFWVSFILSFAILIGIACNPHVSQENIRRTCMRYPPSLSSRVCF